MGLELLRTLKKIIKISTQMFALWSLAIDVAPATTLIDIDSEVVDASAVHSRIDPETFTKNAKYNAWLRLPDPIADFQIDPNGKYLAFSYKNRPGLYMLAVESGKIMRVTADKILKSYIWSPFGYRLFYQKWNYLAFTKANANGVKKQTGEKKKQVMLQAYDVVLHKNIVIDQISGPPSLLNLDKQNLNLQYISHQGLITRHKLYFASQRLPNWHVAMSKLSGSWMATSSAIIWNKGDGAQMIKIKDDGSGVASFHVNHDGSRIVWETSDQRIYHSHLGKTAQFVGFGKHPSWHPRHNVLVYAGARRVGNKTTNFDLRVFSLDGTKKWLTSTQVDDEVLPRWHPVGSQIIYTVDRTVDLYLKTF